MNDDPMLNFSLKAAPFVGSGHHFYFIKADLEEEEILSHLAAIRRDDDCPWVLAEDVETSKKLSWLRARICAEPEGFGLKVALDTTIGNPVRGWPVTPISNASKDVLTEIERRRQTLEAYIFRDTSDVPSDRVVKKVKFEFKTPTGFRQLATLTLDLEFPAPVADVVDVDLIVDFGNTRTVVLGLENNQAANGFLSLVCRPIEFWPRTTEPSDRADRYEKVPSAIIDSWFVLSEPSFGCLETSMEEGRNDSPVSLYEIKSEEVATGMWPFKKKETVATGFRRSMPHSFVQMSPAVLGPEAEKILSQLPLELGGNAFLSSPKRYSWDTDIVGGLGITGKGYWTMHVHPWNKLSKNFVDKKSFPKLEATVLSLMDENGADWRLSDGGKLPPERDSVAARPPAAPDRPSYPRSDALTWAALAVLENAYRHIQSDQWRRQMQHQFVPRRLKNVVVTFPSGWSGQELSSYRSKWQKALDIFTVTHFSNHKPIMEGGEAPKLIMDLDEAVASQLPIVYGEIVRFGNIGENWLQLIGRGEGVDARARIMNLDIGGGTSDVAVIEYQDQMPGRGVVLNTELLFKDSSTIAGDALVRRIIETVLLPAIHHTLSSDAQVRFATFLRAAKQEEGACWNRCTRQILIPIVRRWLTDVSAGIFNDPQTKLAPTPLVMVPGTAEDLIAEFNRICAPHVGDAEVLKGSLALNYDPDRLSRCIEEIFGGYFAHLANVAQSFDCDMLIVSGKPSELPYVKELLLAGIPLPRRRVIFVHNYEVGAWYPVSPDGHVRDAKTVTVAGAALYQAVKQRLVPDWMILPNKVSRFAGKNFWGQMPSQGQKDFTRVILTPEQNQGTVMLMVGAALGRRLLPTRTKPDPVYRLRWSSKGLIAGNEALPVEITLKRSVVGRDAKSGHPTDAISETLEIIAVSADRNGTPLQVDDIELQLCTMDQDDYWIDSGIFHMETNEQHIR